MSTVRSLKQRYLTYLETQWGGSPKMVENYDRYLERFVSFAKVKKPSDITAERVASFRLYLTKQSGAKVNGKVEPMKQLTQNYYLIALRMFLKYLRDEGFETVAPQDVKLAKVLRRGYDSISTAELNRLRTAPDTKTLVGKRDRAIIELLCSTGLRISQLCALTINDINMTERECAVYNARGGVRHVYVGEKAKQAIQKYLQARDDSHPNLFLRYGPKANDGGDPGIYPRAVQRLVKAHATSAGISSTVTPQILRHTFAEELLQSGADVRTVQTLLGHSTALATKIYQSNIDQYPPKLSTDTPT